MEEEPGHDSPSSPSSISVNDVPSGSVLPSTSSSSSSSSDSPFPLVQEEEQDHFQRQEEEMRQSVPYRGNISIPDVEPTARRDEAWSCFAVLVTFWFIASMTLILGLFGPVNLRLVPNYSRLLQANSLFVQDIKVQELAESKSGPMLYGFTKNPLLNVESTWSETHNTSIRPNHHKEWMYFLNEGSQINISYSVKSQSSSPVSLVIAQGKENLVEWLEDPSFPDTTLSWNIIRGTGTIQQKIFTASDYYVAVGNLNSEKVKVNLSFSIRAVLYNTTDAYYKCSLTRGLCSFRLILLGLNVAVLTTPGPEEDTSIDNWYIKLSYGPRWIIYFVGSGGMTTLILLAFKICNKIQSPTGSRTGNRTEDVGSDRTPLLLHKDDDLSSWGSSYDSASHDGEDLEDRLAVGSLEGKPLKDGENSNPRPRCVICFDAQIDCFFLPCGHCAACFTCGTRIAEEAGTCPICRRKMKKVRKIFTV